MPARKCSECGRDLENIRCRHCEAATAIAKPKHAEQAKVTKTDAVATHQGKPKSKSKPVEPWPYKHEPAGFLFLGFGCFMWSIVIGICVVTVVLLFIPTVAYVRNAAVRTETTNHMKDIGLGCHMYHDVHKELPPPRLVTDKNGNRTAVPLSWRVALLPHMKQRHLHNEFDITVAWDHVSNVPLQSRMPIDFTSPFHGDQAPTRETHFQYFIGANTLFPEREKGVALVKIGDGCSNTFMFAEADKAVLWTRPADMMIGVDQPLPLPENEFFATFCDGTVKCVRRTSTSDAVLRQLIDPSDGGPKAWE